jgi:hypothetical protein
VAKQSRTISVPFSSMAESNSALDLRLWTPSLDILDVVVKVLAVGWMELWWEIGAVSLGVCRSTGVVLVVLSKRVVVSSAVLLKAVDARDIQELQRPAGGEAYVGCEMCVI